MAARGVYSGTSGAVNSNTDTTLLTPDTGCQIYVIWVGADTTTAGTTSTSAFKAGASGAAFATFNTTAIGHQSDYFGTSLRDYPGFALGEGVALVVTTAGGAASTGKYSYIAVIK